MVKIFYPVFYRALEPKYVGLDREIRAKKGAKNLFKFSYYVLATITGYFFLKDVPGLPPMLLGKGHLSHVFDGWPFWDKPAYFDIYFTASIGYHLDGFISHLFFAERMNDFVEMFLHHVATCSLIYFSYMASFSQIGAIILWSHHWADIFTSGARVFCDIKGRA